MARAIPYMDTPDEVAVADSIPDLLQPAAITPGGTLNARGH